MSFYTLEDLKFGLQDFCNPLIAEKVQTGYKLFLQQASTNELEKLNLIKESSFINYFTLPICINSKICPQYKENQIKCENFNAPSNTSLELTEYYYGTETKDSYKLRKKIENLSIQDPPWTNSPFGELYEKLKQNCLNPSALLMCFKKEAYIARHCHDWKNGAFHMLVDDIENGYIEVSVGKETKRFSKKGEWFGFDTKNVHTAKVYGGECKLFGLMLHDYVTLRNE